MLNWENKKFNLLSLQELYAIMKLRQEVFVVEQKCSYLDADGKDLESYHLMGYSDNELVAYARLLPQGVGYEEVSIGRIITSAKYRRKEFGLRLMEKAIEEVNRIFGNVPIRIGAQQYLKSFYEKFGFIDINQPYIEDGIPHIIMLRAVK